MTLNKYTCFIRPKKSNVVFPLSLLTKLGLVGREFVLFYQIFFYRIYVEKQIRQSENGNKNFSVGRESRNTTFIFLGLSFLLRVQ